VDGADNVFVADTSNQRICEVDPTGDCWTVAGTYGKSGWGGDGGPALSATLNLPQGVAVDGAGDLYIADTRNLVIRLVKKATGAITTVAGTPPSSTTGYPTGCNTNTFYCGDGGAAASAGLYYPYSVALGASGNLYIADNSNHRIRVVNMQTNTITVAGITIPPTDINTVAGNGQPGMSGDGNAAPNAQLNYPCGIAVDASGNFFIADASNNRIRRVDAGTANITTIAGGGNGGDSGTATSALLVAPWDVLQDSSGNVFIADYLESRVRKVSPSGAITTVAGNGTWGYNGDNIPATSASLSLPAGIALDSGGNLFIADLWNSRIRRVDATSGEITTVAGNGSVGYSGDNGPANQAALNFPYDVAVDASGNLYIADTVNECIREVNTSGTITTVAGTPTSGGSSGNGGLATKALLNSPQAVAVDSSGNIFLADSGNNRIRLVNRQATSIKWGGNTIGSLDIFTVAGNNNGGYSGDGGAATGAALKSPQRVAVDAADNLFIADAGNHRIRRVDAVTGIITTVAGDGNAAFGGDGGPATIANLNNPLGVAVGGAGSSLFIADTGNSRVRRVALAPVVNLSATSLAFDNVTSTTTSAAKTVTVKNEGGANLTISSIAVSANFTQTKTTCPAPTATLDPGSSCTIDLTFTPPDVGLFQGTLTLTDNAGDSPQVVSLSGTGVTPVSTSTSSVSLGGIEVGSGGSYTVTFTNDSGSTIDISSISIGSGFSETNNCGTTLANNHSCTITVSFDPGAPGAASGTLTIDDSDPNSPYSVTFDATGLAAGNIYTVAGGGANSTVATSAVLLNPTGVAVDSQGNTYVASAYFNQVFKLDSAGNLTVVAGNGTRGFSGDGNAATGAQLSLAPSVQNVGLVFFPNGLAVDNSGNLFIADAGNNRIREVASNGTISTVAGNGSWYNCLGDNGPATSACLYWPQGVAVDASGNLFIADYGNSRIREVAAATHHITTLAGGGSPAAGIGDNGPATGASLKYPSGVAVDSSGNVYIADSANARIRVVNMQSSAITVAGVTIQPSDINTVAGGGSPAIGIGDGGLATNASLGWPYGVALDSSGNLFIADNNSIREVNAASSIISTVAGNGVFGFSGDNGVATNASLASPYGVAVDSSGDLFIADYSNNRVREVSASAKSIATVAGGGGGGDGGPASSALLLKPNAVATDSSGNLFIADFDGNRIRRVDASTKVITTVAGNGVSYWSGDGGPATSAGLNSPHGVAVDRAGNIFIADKASNHIRRVDASSHIITTVAGGGKPASGVGDGGPATSASLNAPDRVAVDDSGNIFISDYGNNRVRRVDLSGTITTVAGNGTPYEGGDGGPATNAGLYSPMGMALDNSGNLFIAEPMNVRRVDAATGIITTVAGGGSGLGDGRSATNVYLNTLDVTVDSSANLLIADVANQRIRRVDAVTGIISTVAGNGQATFAGDGGPAPLASLNTPAGVALDASGDLFIADLGNSRVRETTLSPAVTLSATSLTFSNQAPGTTSAPQAITVTNTGSASLTISSLQASGDFAQTNTCPTAPSTLDSGANCSINVTFTPTTGGPLNGAITLKDSAADSPQRVALTGTGIGPAVSLSPGSLNFGIQLLTTTSAAQNITVSSSGTASLTITAINIAGSNSSDFNQSNNCPLSPNTLAAGASCQVSATFSPAASGPRKSAIKISDSSGDSHFILLTGDGTAVGLSPASLSFPSQSVGTSGTPQTVTLSNLGSSPMNIWQMALQGPNAADFSKSSTCGNTLAAGSNCGITVTFTPSAAGTRSARLLISDDGGGSPQSVSLSGTGI
jgi:sugar lactone lactonase YvrE